MKLPANPARNEAALIAPALRDDDVAALCGAGWRRVGASRRTVDVTSWRRRYGMVRLRAERAPVDAAWCCAFDPVRLVADMRDVRLAQWPVAGLDPSGTERLVARVQDLLDDDPEPRVRRLRLVAPSPSRWYLVGAACDALDFIVAPADRLVGHALREHKPAGPDGRMVQRLTTEVQMLLHAEGLPANGVWPHGAGAAPADACSRLPRLYSDDLFWRGCWAELAPAADVAPWAEAQPLPGGAVFAPAPSGAAAALEGLTAARHLSRVDIVTDDATIAVSRGGALRRVLSRLGA